MKTRFCVITSLLVFVFFCDAITVMSQVTVPIRSSARITEGRYFFQLSNGKVMEAESTTFKTEGARIQIGGKKFTLNQLWDIKSAGGGKYFIVNVGSCNALQAGIKGIPGNGAPIQSRTFSPSQELQKWFVQGAGGGKYTFRSAAAEGNKVLDVTGGAINTAGTAIQLWNDANGPNQVWSLVQSFDSAVVRTNFVDLRRNQTALEHQAPVVERGGCTFFGNLGALEAAYKKRGFGELNLSEEFFATMAKVLYIHPKWNEITNSNYRENQFGGLQGGGHINWFKAGLRVPLESVVPFVNVPRDAPNWDTRDQRVTNDFNDDLLVGNMLSAPMYYGAVSGEKLAASLQRNAMEYERLLSLGYEIDVDLNIAHNYLVVGYDKTDPSNPVFFVKDSYETIGARCISDCNRVAYATLLGMVDEAGYITEIRQPGGFLELPFLGTWNLNFDGHRGRLDIYHIPGITNPVLRARDGGPVIVDNRIGVFYDGAGNAFRVNGSIVANKIVFYLDQSTPNQRWDELRGRKFTYYLNPTQNIMSGFHLDPDGSTFAGYATKGSYISHGTADPLIERFVNNTWNLRWGNKSGTVRCTAGEDGTRVNGTFTSSTGTERITFAYDSVDPSLVKVTMGASNGKMKFLSHEKGMLCGSDASGNILLLYK